MIVEAFVALINEDEDDLVGQVEAQDQLRDFNADNEEEAAEEEEAVETKVAGVPIVVRMFGKQFGRDVDNVMEFIGAHYDVARTALLEWLDIEDFSLVTQIFTMIVLAEVSSS